jgi:hypothetical protein
MCPIGVRIFSTSLSCSVGLTRQRRTAFSARLSSRDSSHTPRDDPGDVSAVAKSVLQGSAGSDYILCKVAMQWRRGVYVVMEIEMRVLSGDPRIDYRPVMSSPMVESSSAQHQL